MADRGVIFSGPMVRALLDGRKTQTRRVLKPRPGAQAKWLTMETLHRAPTCYLADVDGRLGVQMQHPLAGTRQSYGAVDAMSPLTWVQLPYAPSDRLWVREAHAMVPYTAYLHSEGVQMTAHAGTYEAAIYREGFDRSQGGIRWRPSIHMPRWASRLTLIVTDVRVQRLQEISEADAVAEGCAEGHTIDDISGIHEGWSARSDFRTVWNSLHGPGAWDANPWVCALTFTVHRCNIDSAEASA